MSEAQETIELLKNALQSTSGNIFRASKLLGWTEIRARRLVKRHSLQRFARELRSVHGALGRHIYDLTNKIFGSLTVIGLGERKNNAWQWIVQCKCGTYKVVQGGDLRLGKVRSCGLSGCKQSSKGIDDLTGRTFGALEVIAFAGVTKKQTYWIVKCACGWIRSIHASRLTQKTNPARSCGCRIASSRAKDLIGHVFGLIKVIAYDGKGRSGRARWVVQCECGVVTAMQRPEKAGSCGCRMQKTCCVEEDLTGKKFGNLTIVAFDGSVNNRACWIVKCSCGNYRSLHQPEKYKSCGCQQVERKCALCGEKYLTGHFLSIYCSKECRAMAMRVNKNMVVRLGGTCIRTTGSQMKLIVMARLKLQDAIKKETRS